MNRKKIGEIRKRKKQKGMRRKDSPRYNSAWIQMLDACEKSSIKEHFHLNKSMYPCNRVSFGLPAQDKDVTNKIPADITNQIYSGPSKLINNERNTLTNHQYSIFNHSEFGKIQEEYSFNPRKYSPLDYQFRCSEPHKKKAYDVVSNQNNSKNKTDRRKYQVPEFPMSFNNEGEMESSEKQSSRIQSTFQDNYLFSRDHFDFSDIRLPKLQEKPFFDKNNHCDVPIYKDQYSNAQMLDIPVKDKMSESDETFLSNPFTKPNYGDKHKIKESLNYDKWCNNIQEQPLKLSKFDSNNCKSSRHHWRNRVNSDDSSDEFEWPFSDNTRDTISFDLDDSNSFLFKPKSKWEDDSFEHSRLKKKTSEKQSILQEQELNNYDPNGFRDNHFYRSNIDKYQNRQDFNMQDVYNDLESLNLSNKNMKIDSDIGWNSTWNHENEIPNVFSSNCDSNSGQTTKKRIHTKNSCFRDNSNVFWSHNFDESNYTNNDHADECHTYENTSSNNRGNYLDFSFGAKISDSMSTWEALQIYFHL